MAAEVAQAALDSRGTTLPPGGEPEATSPACTVRGSYRACGSAHERHRLQRGIAQLLRDPETGRGPSVCGCGYSGYQAEEVELARAQDGRARTAGVHRCDSLYLCPVCTMRRAMEVQERARRFAEAAMGAGAFVFMVTLTVRHDREHGLQELRDGIAQAFRRAQQGAPYQRLQAAGLAGAFRTVEVRVSERAGWHPHIHALVPVLDADEPAARATAQALVARYLDRLRKAGLDARQEGQDVTRCYDPQGAGEYAGKGALELAQGWGKQGRNGSVHPFELARRAVDEADRRAAALFREYAAAMPGTPQGRISDRVVRLFAERLGKDEGELAAWLRHGEPDDEAQPGEEHGAPGQDEDVARVGADDWNRLHRDGHTAELVRLLEAGASFEQLRDAGWPVMPPLPYAGVSAYPPGEGEDLHAAGHRTAPGTAPNGTRERGEWVKAYVRCWQAAPGVVMGTRPR